MRAKMKDSLLAVAAILLYVLSVPQDGAMARSEIPIDCALSLEVSDPGTDVRTGAQIQNTGQAATGLLDCDLDALDGPLTTLHGSDVTFDAAGNFKGRLIGTFRVATSRGVLPGEVRADVTGVMAVPGDPATVYLESVVGRWKLAGQPVGAGALTLLLEPFQGERNLTLNGVGALSGMVRFGP